jgi:hypothetical protein
VASRSFTETPSGDSKAHCAIDDKLITLVGTSLVPANIRLISRLRIISIFTLYDANIVRRVKIELGTDLSWPIQA